MKIGGIERAIIGKYNRPVPRYTSYPTALQFRDDIPRQSLLDQCAESAEPLSVYVHLPFCESLCWYCGCNTVITRNHSQADRYLDAVERELGLYGPVLGAQRAVRQLHLGGGTPNFLTPVQLRRLGRMLQEHFAIEAAAECSVELDPRTLTQEQIAIFRDFGFNRASFGVQDCNPAVQRAVHRVQPHEQNIQTMSWLRDAGFQSINIDLIYGLPLQTADSFRETLKTVLALNPDRLALFSYAHVPWIKPAQKILEQSALPQAEEKLRIFIESLEYLTTRGYDHIGMDHFARVDDELARAARAGTMQRNFQGYSTSVAPSIAGFGVSAISQTPASYRQNHKQLDDYYEAVNHDRLPIERGLVLSREDRMRADLIQRIMCNFALDTGEFARRWGISFDATFSDAWTRLGELETDGLVHRSSDRLDVTELGRLLIRNIAEVFDAYANPAPNRHARAI